MTVFAFVEVAGTAELLRYLKGRLRREHLVVYRAEHQRRTVYLLQPVVDVQRVKALSEDDKALKIRLAHILM